MSSITDVELAAMDRRADAVINRWAITSFTLNLTPPPFDTMVVGSAFAGLGAHLGRVYGQPVDLKQLKLVGRSIAKGVGAVVIGGYVGTGLLKWVPGVNIWIALLVQPPLVAAIAHSVGHAFKRYYRVQATDGRILSSAEMLDLAQAELRRRLGSGRFDRYAKHIV